MKNSKLEFDKNWVEKPVGYFIPAPGFILLPRFGEYGIYLTHDEALHIGRLCYTGLTGHVEVLENGIECEMQTHPLVEAIFEWMMGSSALGNSDSVVMAKSILMKLGVDPATTFVSVYGTETLAVDKKNINPLKN